MFDLKCKKQKKKVYSDWKRDFYFFKEDLSSCIPMAPKWHMQCSIVALPVVNLFGY